MSKRYWRDYPKIRVDYLQVDPVVVKVARALRTTRNIILLATDTALARDTLERRIRDRVGGRVTVDGFERFSGNLYTGLVSLAGAPLLTDAYAPVDSLIEVD